MSTPRSITLLTATSLVVANMVGTGVFTSLGFQVEGLPTGFSIVALWLLGGICAFCGALAYGELAAALPRSGGEYHYLSRIYHPAIGFTAGWISGTVGFAVPVALASMAFGTYFSSIFPEMPAIVPSLCIVGLVTGIHLRGGSLGSLFQTVATTLKVVLILSLILAGLTLQNPQPVSFLPQAGDVALLTSPPFAVSLVYVMYAYSGWNASTYIVGEMANPSRDLPRSVAMGTLLVVLLYLGLNAIFLLAAPISALAGVLDVGHVAAEHIFGPTGGRIMAGLICAGLVSSISAMTWVGPRVSMAMGEDCHLLRVVAYKTPRGIPSVAILTQSLLVILLLLMAGFQSLLNYIQFSLNLCSFLTVLGVFVLRFTQPELPRPYRCWGYPWTPLIFLAVSLWMLCHVFFAHPWQSLAGLATMATGLLIYWVSPTRPLAPSR